MDNASDDARSLDDIVTDPALRAELCSDLTAGLREAVQSADVEQVAHFLEFYGELAGSLARVLKQGDQLPKPAADDAQRAARLLSDQVVPALNRVASSARQPDPYVETTFWVKRDEDQRQVVALDPALPAEVRKRAVSSFQGQLNLRCDVPRWRADPPPAPTPSSRFTRFMDRVADSTDMQLRYDLYRRVVRGDDLNAMAWGLAQRALAARAAITMALPDLQRLPQAERLGAEVGEQMWQFAHRAAEWSRLHRVRREVLAGDPGGHLPEQALAAHDRALAQEESALKDMVVHLEDQAQRLSAARERQRALEALGQLAERAHDFSDLMAADAADRHAAETWDAHHEQAEALARQLDEDLATAANSAAEALPRPTRSDTAPQAGEAK
ncbi:hypothetical protein [Streptomyces aureoverticillatus]|uniref:hypothetical protein n=1 Tax=Streptomyces aureoverticillatus TaxID=66871 RepID=UPI0013DD2772|nr:hypothetical protein [Streptomyces aureoverticillatus]QIB49537.1 hypothetical protein G3H79_40940 [Streptomyces aureoverticillatus]